MVLALFIIGRATNTDQPEPTSTLATTAQASGQAASGTTSQPEATAGSETTALPVKVTSE